MLGRFLSFSLAGCFTVTCSRREPASCESKIQLRFPFPSITNPVSGVCPEPLGLPTSTAIVSSPGPPNDYL